MKRVLGRDLDSIAPHFDHNPEPEADISRHANPLAAVGWWAGRRHHLPLALIM